MKTKDKAMPASIVLVALLVISGPAQAERLALPLALPQDAPRCRLEGWAYSNGLVEVVLRQAPDAASPALGIVPLGDPLTPALHGDGLYPALMTISQYASGWLKVSALTDQENGEAARDVPPAAGWIAANGIRFTIQSGQGHAAPDAGSAVLIDLQDDWATELGQIDEVRACQGDWVLVAYRQTLARDAKGALSPLAGEQQLRKQAWFRNTCGDLFTTCDRTAERIGQ